MNQPAVRRPMPLASKVGLALTAVSLLWWFFYYANYDGAFGLLGLKFACITGATRECLFFQERILTPIPTYWPLFWYPGLAALLYGTYQNWRARSK